MVKAPRLPFGVPSRVRPTSAAKVMKSISPSPVASIATSTSRVEWVDVARASVAAKTNSRSSGAAPTDSPGRALDAQVGQVGDLPVDRRPRRDRPAARSTAQPSRCVRRRCAPGSAGTPRAPWRRSSRRTAHRTRAPARTGTSSGAAAPRRPATPAAPPRSARGSRPGSRRHSRWLRAAGPHPTRLSRSVTATVRVRPGLMVTVRGEIFTLVPYRFELSLRRRS